MHIYEELNVVDQMQVFGTLLMSWIYRFSKLINRWGTHKL